MSAPSTHAPELNNMLVRTSEDEAMVGKPDIYPIVVEEAEIYNFYLQMFNINEGDTFTENTALETFDRILGYLLFVHRTNTESDIKAVLKVVKIILQNIKTEEIDSLSPLFSQEYWNNRIITDIKNFDAQKIGFYNAPEDLRDLSGLRFIAEQFKQQILNKYVEKFQWYFDSSKGQTPQPITITYINDLGKRITSTGRPHAVGEDFIILNGVSIKAYSIINLEVVEERQETSELVRDLDWYRNLPPTSGLVSLHPVVITYRNGGEDSYTVAGKPTVLGPNFIVVNGIKIEGGQIIDMTLMEA